MSEFFGAFHFVRPAALLLAPVALAVYWAWTRSADPLRGWRQQVDRDLLEAFVERGGAGGRRPGLVSLVAWLLATLAVAGPTWRLEPSPFVDDVAPLVVVLEAGETMDVPDPAPSRMERAHLKVDDLAKARGGEPLGLVAYAGSAHLVLPPTRDTSIVATMANEVSPAVMPVGGDRLDLALAEAARVIADGGGGGSAVVVTDSVEVEPARLDGAFDGPIQFLSVAVPGTREARSIQAAADALDAPVAALDLAGSSDVEALVRRARGAPVARGGDDGTRWQEAGYWLVPLIALLVLLSFRREENAEVSS
ncbi:MAG: VWA domain-containing protein [Planctomycetota bacterium]